MRGSTRVLSSLLLLASCGRIGFERQVGALEPPVIEGEPSAGHLDLFWRWSTPAGTSSFRWWIDAGSPASVAADMSSAMFTAPGEGDYTIHVQACDASGACSLEATFTTRVELFGQDRVPAWRGVARAGIATTPLSRLAGVLCAACEGDAAGVGPTLAEAGPRVARALARGADGIEIRISYAAGELVVGDDPASPSVPTGRVSLAELLGTAELTASDAIVVLDVRENDHDPSAFADAVLDALDARPDIARNGRPLWVRTTQARAAYASAIRQRANDSPFVRPYLRFHVAFEASALASTSAFAAAVDAERAGGADGVMLAPDSPNLVFGTGYARANDLAVTIGWIEPGGGDVLVGALREEADALSSRYRVDRARTIVEERNTVLYVSPSREVDDTQLRLHRADSITDLQTRPVARAATSSLYGTPALATPGPAGPLFGPALSFDRAALQALDTWDADIPAGRRLLIAAAVRLNDLEDQVILTKAQTSGWVLEVKRDAGFPMPSLDLAVHDGTGFVRHRYPVTGGSHPIGDVRTDRAYLLIGVWDASDRLTLYIDGVAVAGAPVATAIAPNDVPIFVGADPEAIEPTGARFYLSGQIEVAAVLDWIGAPAGPGEIND
ncbi:MAG: hypothetical protein IT378_20925 [Sandaracinaceae bacterium]|nr:hypothetical protein [Sandaracinaceae bacterium]